MGTPEQIIRERLTQAAPPPIEAMAGEMRRQFGDAVSAVVFYGSCLRKGDPTDGIVDLYVVVSSYADAYARMSDRLLATVLPPTVGYKELETTRGRIRAKYAVISARDFRRGTGGQWFHPYLWGRFAQPCLLAYSRCQEDREMIVTCMARAAETLIRRTMALAPPTIGALALWRSALELSYGTELRPESTGRADDLVTANADFYLQLSRALASRLGLVETGDGSTDSPVFGIRTTSRQVAITRLAWAVRRVTGKLLSPLRWLKAAATFDGGLDYAAWKLERHTGERIEIPEKVRQRPWLHVWGELWRLYRRGVLK